MIKEPFFKSEILLNIYNNFIYYFTYNDMYKYLLIVLGILLLNYLLIVFIAKPEYSCFTPNNKHCFDKNKKWQNILEKFISIAKEEAKLKNSSVSTIITHKLSELNEYTGGYNFITVIKKFYEAVESGNDDLKNCAINWLKAGYTTKTETYKDLGIKDFINDASFFNTLILYSCVVLKKRYRI